MNPRRPCRQDRLCARNSQSGQALTEFLVAALAIVPLFLLMPLIAKYQDIGHATQLASRYTAFDATVNNPSTNGVKNAAALAQEVRRRFFSHIDAPIRTNDAAGNFLAHQNLFWRGPTGTSLIADINGVAVNLSTTAAPQTTFLSAAGSAAGLVSSPLHRGAVSAPLARLPAGIRSYEPLDRIDLRVDRSTTMLVDGWGSRDLATTRSRVERMAPLGDAMSVVATAASLPFAVIELGQVAPPQVGELQRWDDVVPMDRLQTR
jgi:hypothetical protein